MYEARQRNSFRLRYLLQGKILVGKLLHIVNLLLVVCVTHQLGKLLPHSRCLQSKERENSCRPTQPESLRHVLVSWPNPTHVLAHTYL